MPTALSPYPDLEQLKKQAKDLCKAHGDGSLQAAHRLRAHVRAYSSLAEQDVLASRVKLRDAQHVVAREHGFAGWQELREALGRVAPEPRSLLVHAPDYREEDLVPVQILRIDFKERELEVQGTTVTVNQAWIFLRDAGGRVLPIVTGEAEGQALVLSLQRRRLPRPLGHELLTACLGELGATVHSLVIHAIHDETFHSHVRLDAGGRRITLDARPSDALTLAVRNQATVYVTGAVLQAANAGLQDLPKMTVQRDKCA